MVRNIVNIIDKKDRKILTLLDEDAREPLHAISRKVRLPKSVVSYRMQRMVGLGLIKSFHAVIDYSRLGFQCFRFYISLCNCDQARLEEIVDFFVKSPKTIWVAKVHGEFDLNVILVAPNLVEVQGFWDSFRGKYRQNIDRYVFSAYTSETHFKLGYLPNEENWKGNAPLAQIGLGKPEQVDRHDKAILKEISSNARSSLLSISKSIGVSPPAIKKHLKRLVDKKIIAGFRIEIDQEKLGYSYFKLFIHLNDFSEYKLVRNFLISNPHMVYLVDAVGMADIEAEFHYKSASELDEFLDDLKKRFPKSINKAVYYDFPEVYKLQYLPEL
jgi:Lrp/AsnC family leucine-responsive transcriptional regulator